MNREKQIKAAWESAFKNVAESVDAERTKEELASMFFELGCRWSDENRHVDWMQVRIQAAIAAMQGMCANPIYFDLNNGVPVTEASIIYADDLIERLKEE